ncbi:MAG TPA: pilus assembly protein TadG-related protein [Phycisphaerae bacterium]|nr:pilus assembly protein TadG-related protein [Phycisphaerae bacterium]
MRWLQKLHEDRAGAISVLVLLTLWCLVAIVGMLWNTAEYSMRRQAVQSAADSAAHSAATWMTRDVNAEAAQNMIIAQDAAAEAVWRAVPPTDASIKRELTSELAQATRLLATGDPQLVQQRNTLQRLLTQADSEYAQTQDALARVIGDSAGLDFPDPTAAAKYQFTLRQASEALQWVNDTYINGGPANYAQRPGPPGPNGEGLRQLVAKFVNSPMDAPMLQAIIDSLQQQLAVLSAFEERTAPATSQPVDAQMQSHEQQVFQAEQDVASQLPDVVDRQRQSLADFHRTDITLATPQRPLDDPDGSANVIAPVVTADVPAPVEGHIDSIRTEYLPEAIAAGLSPIVEIDPINPNTLDNRIWHPDLVAPVPADVSTQYPSIAGSFLVSCNVPGGWGHSWAFPIEHYLTNRVWTDQATLNATYMQQIDLLRQQLAQKLAEMRGFGTDNVQPLPPRLIDSQLDPQGVRESIPVLPRLTAPAGADAAYRSEVTIYNQHAGNYTSRVRALANALNGFAAYYDRFTRPFAVNTWVGQIRAARTTVLENLGTAKQFMVLSTYGLRPIPDWAQNGMLASATAAARAQIISQNMIGVTNQVLSALVRADPQSLGGGFLDNAGKQQYLRAMYSGLAAQIAREVIEEAADQAAPEIAAEMVSRPWPYEITPPNDVVPPSRGMGRDDRLSSFTVLAAARELPQTAAKPLLTTIFGASPTKLVAFAQAETFNWMEFNDSYGGSEQFDVVSPVPYDGGEFIACPRAWRLSTVGGWSWQSKLSLSDGLPDALQNNPDFAQYFNDAGITGTDPDALNQVMLH